MNIRFHPPKNEEKYADQVFAVLLQAAMPQVKAQLEALLRDEAARTEACSA